LQHAVTGEIVERDGFAARKRMARGDGEHSRLADQDGPGDQIRFLDRQHQEQEIDLVGAEEREPVAELVLADLNVASRVQRLEGRGDLQHETAGRGAEEADAQRALNVASGRDRAGDARLDLLERRPEVIAQAPADRRERDLTARALEQ
jgi:hypothetical protein